MRRRSRKRQDEGYALLVVLLMLSLLVLALAQAMPSWSVQIRREHEARAIDHARDYRTAIRRYFHQYGRYPPSLDVLLQQDGHGVRYLREAWNDPLVQGKDAPTDSHGRRVQTFHGWQVLHYGQAVTAEIVDQPPTASTGKKSAIAGPDLAGEESSTGSSATLSPGHTLPPLGGLSAGLGAGAMRGISGVGGSLGQAGVDAGSTVGPSSGGLAFGSGPGAGIGGGPVIGVVSPSAKLAVHAFNGFDQPDRWQFVYNFATDTTLRGAVTAPATGQRPMPGLGPGEAGQGSTGQGGNSPTGSPGAPGAGGPGIP